VNVLVVAVEGELQDPCSGNVEPVAKRGDIRRDQAEVLGDER